MTIAQKIVKIGRSMVRDSKGLHSDETGIYGARADQQDAHNKPEGQQGNRGKGFTETPFIGTHWFGKESK